MNSICDCKCHNKDGPKILHCVACCYLCEGCNERIRSSAYVAHKKQCVDKKECEHNWVMDGHNAGDPICSKCYARE